MVNVIPTPVILEQYLRCLFSHAVMLSELVEKCRSFRLGPQDEQLIKRLTRPRWIYTFFMLFKVEDRHLTLVLILTDDGSPL